MNKDFGWQLYVMAAPADDGSCFFKIGITRDIAKRPTDIQVGCPLPIREILFVELDWLHAARDAEGKVHAELAAYKTSGEWFRFTLTDPEHKKAFNGGIRRVLAEFLEPGWTWSRITPDRLKRELREDAAEYRRAEKQKHMAALMQGRNHAY